MTEGLEVSPRISSFTVNKRIIPGVPPLPPRGGSTELGNTEICVLTPYVQAPYPWTQLTSTLEDIFFCTENVQMPDWRHSFLYQPSGASTDKHCVVLGQVGV